MKSPDWVLPRPSAARPAMLSSPARCRAEDPNMGQVSRGSGRTRSTAVKSSQVKSSPSTLTSTASLESTFDRLVP